MVALAHWLTLSLSALAAPRAPAPEVVWIDLANVPALAREEARREAIRVLETVGIAPGWRSGRSEDVLVAGEIPVVLLPQDRSFRGGPRVLGACLPRRAGRVWVFLDTLAWVLGLPGGSGPRPERALALGRAIGRIVAHEVIHAVAPGLEHARTGIMAATLGRSQLLTARLEVDAVTRGALRRSIALGRASSTPPTS